MWNRMHFGRADVIEECPPSRLEGSVAFQKPRADPISQELKRALCSGSRQP